MQFALHYTCNTNYYKIIYFHMNTTRDIINISLPKEMAQEVRKEAKSGGYSVSEYVRYILREWKKENLARELRAEREQFVKGKGKVISSLKSLR